METDHLFDRQRGLVEQAADEVEDLTRLVGGHAQVAHLGAGAGSLVGLGAAAVRHQKPPSVP
ncbi:MAG: hypothetical protein HC794_05240 [Nitrospiraceae bacterium]|nr:hypothetical protein [Nitrospiraceae bacterium]